MIKKIPLLVLLLSLCTTLQAQFITTWETTTANESITIPTIGTGYNYTVDWGDGDTSINQMGDATHAYATAGTYAVTITGDFPRIYFNNTGDRLKIKSIKQWGNQKWDSMLAAFRGCAYLEGEATDTPDLSNVENMSRMFDGASIFNQNIGDWDVSNVKYMIEIFHRTVAFNQDIGDWDVSNVENMSDMFHSAVAFNQDIGEWNVSKVTEMSDMFNFAILFNQNLGSWNVSNVTTMHEMFYLSKLSTENYEALLKGWSSLSLQSNLSFEGGYSTYCSEEAENARQKLIDNFNWSIDDRGKYCPFITTWETTTANESITIPTEGTGYNYTVNWGDETTDVDLKGNATHTYALAGTYTVTISEDFPRIHFNNSGDKLKIQTIENWGTQTWESMENAFYGCENLQINATDPPDLSYYNISLSNMFRGVSNFNQDIGNWDVSHVKSMEGMFDGATHFNQDIGNWDVSSVTSMKNMFRGASSFDGNIGNWNSKVDNVEDMEGMFDGATHFNQGIKDWDVSMVTNMTHMFRGASSFNRNLLNWSNGVRNVKYMEGMFDGATAYNQSMKDWNVSGVTNMKHMFRGASKFNGSLENWYSSVRNVENMEGMFDGAEDFNRDLISWNVSSVTNMKHMFRGASKFNGSLENWYSSVRNVENMEGMFDGAEDFNQDLEGWYVIKVTNMKHMFRGASNFNGSLDNWYSSVRNVENMEGMFDGAEDFNQDLEGWYVIKVTNMKHMFRGASNFNGSLDNWYSFVYRVENMEGMFDNATSFSQDIGGWNISNVTTMKNMFQGVTLSTEHYEALLKGWSSRGLLQSGVYFNGGNSVYCNTETERQKLIDAGWTITDGGKDCGLSTPDIVAETLRLYPIPTAGSITIDIEGTIEQLAIYNLQGAEIWSEKKEDSKKIDLSDLSSGTYVLKVQTDKGTVVRKIVKK
ncbi:BspA family leucine-rich repeat surface protein [Flavivirga jejuensis]|uniref:BspA family leucine-rich repeat surface protein n=1 Tax=Flavivirga jejuensis TaxID=870487 RepID=A0ABT8WMP5_9FLAO|nr:BspA family leucine-rich repeat surface protein [Flavivirga jejuensis]MDO5974393.1 BspA family leucine-rich repeat surface protein [Flavivirga jejuensis]